MPIHYLAALLITSLTALSAPQAIQAQTTVIGSGSSGVVTVIPVVPGRGGERNSLGWNTGYSAITTTSERPSLLGRSLGNDNTISETVTRVVPNDALGNPVEYGRINSDERNSAGWNTGYSTITSTYERRDPLNPWLGASDTVTETKTQVVPNDALGQPIRPLSDLWR